MSAAPFDAQYAAIPAKPASEAVERTFTIRPPSWPLKRAANSREVRNVPVALTSSARCQSPKDVSSAGARLVGDTPAALTSSVASPSVRLTCANALQTLASLETSHWTMRASSVPAEEVESSTATAVPPVNTASTMAPPIDPPPPVITATDLIGQPCRTRLTPVVASHLLNDEALKSRRPWSPKVRAPSPVRNPPGPGMSDVLATRNRARSALSGPIS